MTNKRTPVQYAESSWKKPVNTAREPWAPPTGQLWQSKAVTWFFRLTATTSPAPHDIPWFREVIQTFNLGDTIIEDDGNFMAWIGDGPETFETLFIAHIDTADFGEPRSVSRKYANGLVRTDGKTILGADDKSGMAIMMAMIEAKVSGTYMFVHSEERGRKGSIRMAKEGWGKGYQRAIQFDRYGTGSIITHQMGERSCSNKFADELSLMLASADPRLILDSDDGGVYTDTYSFHSTIPECTNISVGYWGQHSVQETQDLVYLAALADACIFIPWHELPTVQDMKDRESLWGKHTYGGYGYQGYKAPAPWKPGDKSNMGNTRTSLPDDFWSDDKYDAYGRWSYGADAREELVAKAEAGKMRWQDVRNLVSDHPLEAADMLFDFLELGG